MKYVRELNEGYGISRAIRLLDADVSPSQEYTDELHCLLNHVEWVSDRDGSIFIFSDGEEDPDINVEPGDWLVVRDSGEIEVYTHDLFAEKHGAV